MLGLSQTHRSHLPTINKVTAKAARCRTEYSPCQDYQAFRLNKTYLPQQHIRTKDTKWDLTKTASTLLCFSSYYSFLLQPTNYLALSRPQKCLYAPKSCPHPLLISLPGVGKRHYSESLKKEWVGNGSRVMYIQYTQSFYKLNQFLALLS